MPDLSPVTRWHQQVQDAQAVSGQRVLEGIDIELVEPIDKLLLPDNCFYAQPPYDYANVLDEGPNTSTVPVVSGPIRGLIYGLAITSIAVILFGLVVIL